MKKNTFLLLALIAGMFVPSIASAHERQVFDLHGTKYLFVVGSLGEPLVVDDKTGVDLRVKLADPVKPEDSNAVGAKPVTGLEATLQVEISAGEKKKVLPLSPVYNDAGAYKAVFFPTVQTTYTYRFFGTLSGMPVNLSFVCNAEGHAKAADDSSSVVLEDGVMRTFKAGGFGCPLAKADLGFPEKAPNLLDLSAVIDSSVTGSRTALIFGVISLVIGLAVLRKSSKLS